jgi:hypothetical protein
MVESEMFRESRSATTPDCVVAPPANANMFDEIADDDDDF